MPVIDLLSEAPPLLVWGVTLLVVLPIAHSLFQSFSLSSLPTVNQKSLWDVSGSKARANFMMNGRALYQEAVKKFPNKPYRAHTEIGFMTILPPSMANEVKNDARLSHNQHIFNSMMADYPGFEGFRVSGNELLLVREVITSKLTQALTKVTEPLSDECNLALNDLFGPSKEWHAIPLKQNILQLVARLSSRVFLGESLCRDPKWLDITINYTIDSFMASDELRMWSSVLRPVAVWFLPRCRRLRQQLRDAYSTIKPILDERKAERAAQTDGEAPKRYEDAIQWFEDLSKGRKYDEVQVQLGLSVAAIHTATDLIAQTIFDLVSHPELIEPLREEMKTVIAEEGWTKMALFKLKLLDSVIKESQRMKPASFVAMRRGVMENVTLADGTVLPKGSDVGVSSHSMWDSALHADPEKYDGYRFLKIRSEPGKENSAQLVTTGPDHLAFGHGKHACPGRFFAANEIKIALIHILSDYDIRLAQDSKPTVMAFGMNLSADVSAKLEVRRRETSIL